MRRYDRGYGRDLGARSGSYDWRRTPGEITGARPWSPRDVRYGRWDGPTDYDRGVYGGGYEAPAGGYAEGPARRGWGGYADDFDGGWQAGYARGPFLPDRAYRRHPELDREPGPRGGRWGYERDDTGWDLEDGQVLDAVRRRLYDDVWLDVDRIDVEVEDGVVTLRGEVDDFMEARYAWDDAWETAGVRGVVNLLTVRVDQPEPRPHGDVLPQTTHGQASEPREQGIGNRE